MTDSKLTMNVAFVSSTDSYRGGVPGANRDITRLGVEKVSMKKQWFKVSII